MSASARSNVVSCTWLKRSAEVALYRLALEARKAEMLAWLIGTPLGTPVDPEVNNTYARLSGFRRAGVNLFPARWSIRSLSDRGARIIRTAVPGVSDLAGAAPAGSTMGASHPAIAITCRLRDTGSSGLSGTAVAPAYKAASRPIYASGVLAATTATTRGGACLPVNVAAQARASRSTSE